MTCVLTGVLADVWCTGLLCCSLAVWVWLGWFFGGFDCAVVFVVLGDAGPLLFSTCNTSEKHYSCIFFRNCSPVFFLLALLAQSILTQRFKGTIMPNYKMLSRDIDVQHG